MSATENEEKLDRCIDKLRECNRHLQTYIRRSVVVENDELREYAKHSVLRKARHIVKLSELIRYYKSEVINECNRK